MGNALMDLKLPRKSGNHPDDENLILNVCNLIQIEWNYAVESRAFTMRCPFNLLQILSRLDLDPEVCKLIDLEKLMQNVSKHLPPNFSFVKDQEYPQCFFLVYEG